jgi:hypothetical protein
VNHPVDRRSIAIDPHTRSPVLSITTTVLRIGPTAGVDLGQHGAAVADWIVYFDQDP